MNLGDLYKVWEVRALKNQGQDEARKLLEKVAEHVQPIMRKRKFTVKVLSEFCQRNLLGLNIGGGAHVKLRLRYPDRPLAFLPFHEILDTMLHELCHNVHGPHDANFYRLWDELRQEYEENLRKGVTGTGQGFNLPGRRLGGCNRQPPLSSLRATAAAAAEKRVRSGSGSGEAVGGIRLGSLPPIGRNRLGGDKTIMAALSPVQAAAMAAERRLQDDLWCRIYAIELAGNEENFPDAFEVPDSVSNGSSSSGKRSSGSDAGLYPQSSNMQPNFNGSTKDDSSKPFYVHGAKSPKRSRASHDGQPVHSGYQSKPSFMDPLNNLASRPKPDPDSGKDGEESAKWECTTCTLLNPPLAPICELCFTTRPKDMATESKIWKCKFCTLENSVKLDNCAACLQWRYSYGQPVSARASHLET